MKLERGAYRRQYLRQEGDVNEIPGISPELASTESVVEYCSPLHHDEACCTKNASSMLKEKQRRNSKGTQSIELRLVQHQV